MFKKYCILFCLFFHISFGKTDPKLISFDAIDTSNNTKEKTITFTIPEKDFIYKDFISCSINEPGITLSPWKADKCSTDHYDPSFKETKPVFNETFSISMTATSTTQYYNEPIHLYCSYYRNADKKINHTLFPLAFTQPIDTHIQIQDAMIEESITKKQFYSIDQYHSFFDKWYYQCTIIMQNIITFFKTHYQKIFYFLIFLMSLLFFIAYFYHEQLKKHRSIYEWIETILSLTTIMVIIYLLMHAYVPSTAIMKTIIMNISVLSSGITGIYYIKKSTNLQSGFLRTFCACLGNGFIYVAVYLGFKTLQFYL